MASAAALSAATAQAAIPLDVNNYKDIFSDASFWDPKLDDEDVMKLLDKRVLGEGKSGGELWGPLVDTRTEIIGYVNESGDGAAVRMRDSARRWQREEDSAKPILQWIARRDKGGAGKAQDVVAKVKESLRGPPKTLDDFIQRELSKMRDAKARKLKHAAGETFFVGSANFRHKGVSLESPGKIFLDEVNMQRESTTVFVYSSESGSGKTVELAASAFVRDCAVSMVDIVPKEADLSKTLTKEQRSRECVALLKKRFDNLAKNNTEVFETILQTINDWEEPNNNDSPVVRIVFCIDEASSCLNLVQVIISEYEALYKTMGKYIASGFGGVLDKKFKTKHPIGVVFSVAGTGAYGATVGSKQAHYKYLKPSGNTVTEELYDTLRSEYKPGTYGYKNIATFKDLTKQTFLGLVVTGNARMASILIAEMFRKQLRHNDPNDEIRLMYSVFEKFIESNGMDSLLLSHEGLNRYSDIDDDAVATDRMAASSQAFAVLLYPEPFNLPADDAEAQSKVLTLDYGPSFQAFGADKRATAPANEDNRLLTPMQRLVRKYGIIIPAEFDGDTTQPQTLQEPFKMKEVMQLLCLWLANSGKRLKGDDVMLGKNSFSYEVLSTQLVSCAISAAMIIKEEERKDLRYILTNSLNMFLRSYTYTNDDITDDIAEHVDADITAAWGALEGVIPVSTECDLALDGMYYQPAPMWLNKRSRDGTLSKMGPWKKARVIRVTPPENGDPSDLSNVKQEDITGTDGATDNLNTLSINKYVWQGLEELATNKGIEPTKFFPTLTTVAEGNSNLADGYVSFIGAKWNEDNSELVDHALYTIFIQAKDYDKKTSLKSDDIRKTKELVCSEELKLHFGRNGLYCLACSKEKLSRVYNENVLNTELNADQRREMGCAPYVSFPTNQMRILPHLMGEIDGSRKRHDKMDAHNHILAFNDNNNNNDNVNN